MSRDVNACKIHGEWPAGSFSIENSLDDRTDSTKSLILSITYLARLSEVIIDVCHVTSRGLDVSRSAREREQRQINLARICSRLDLCKIMAKLLDDVGAKHEIIRRGRASPSLLANSLRGVTDVFSRLRQANYAASRPSLTPGPIPGQGGGSIGTKKSRGDCIRARAGNRKEQSFEITDTVSLQSSREESRDGLTTAKYDCSRTP